ncbi:MAG: hypothetical protein JSS83_26670 [Cyanobacteria bacterium SZAS LIN-3]|nr:hypothetical protein [Cyanobacteria bacterium SZAS LIN-3]
MLTRSNFVFVLLRPNFLGNIGSAARVMKNFGFNQLRLVTPPKNYLDAEARKMAVDAFDVLKKAKVCASLSEALEDVTLAVATSCGQYRKSAAVDLTSLLASFHGDAKNAPLSDENVIAFVFGDERNGMTNEEIDRCHKLMRIESDPQFPSLNLALALGIVAYQTSLTITSHDNTKGTTDDLAVLKMSGREEDELIDKVVSLMDLADFSRSFSRKKVSTELRGTIQRLDLTQREGQLWLGLLSKIIARLPPVE